MSNSKPATKTDRVSAFRAKFDKKLIIPARIKAGLEKLGADWRYEEDFRKEIGLAQADFSKYKEQFSDFFFEVREMGKGPKRVWCGTKEFATELKEHATS